MEGGEHLGRYSFVGCNPRAIIRQVGNRIELIENGKVTGEFVVSHAPPPAVIDVLHEAARVGARSATIFTSGIGDATDADGIRLGADVARVIRATGLAVSGPNCMGNFCARTRMATLNDPRALPTVGGPVAMVGQSGGVMLFTAHALHDRCIGVGYIITSGNEIGLTTADYIAAFAAEDFDRALDP